MVSRRWVAPEQVVRDDSLEVEAKKPIVPLLLEPVSIPQTLRYPLAGIQHLELFGGDSEGKLHAILRSLTRLGITAAEADLACGQTGSILAPGQNARLRPTTPGAPHNLPLQMT